MRSASILRRAPKNAAAPKKKSAGAAPARFRSLVYSTVIPALLRRHKAPISIALDPHAEAPATKLARLLVSADPDHALELIDNFQLHGSTHADLCERYFEPAARALGDFWAADVCSEFDVTAGLCRLRALSRTLLASVAARTLPAGQCPRVLATTAPGEPHLLSALFDVDVLWQAGWNVHFETPQSDASLQSLVAATAFDAIDLSLSPVFRRVHWLARLKQTIARARKASLNPNLLVVVGGRVFAESPRATTEVGADACSRSASQIERVIRRGLSCGVRASLRSELVSYPPYVNGGDADIRRTSPQTLLRPRRRVHIQI